MQAEIRDYYLRLFSILSLLLLPVMITDQEEEKVYVADIHKYTQIHKFFTCYDQEKE